jgi:tRNA-splicing ligase RtcB
LEINDMRDKVQKIDDFLYELPRTGKMRVPARIYASENMLGAIFSDNAPEQAANVAWLPGIVDYSMAMPDIHWGYGFPIGGVAAFDVDTGVVSPGGVGYDINCGVRLLRTDLVKKEIKSKLPAIVESLFKYIPSGVGSTGQIRLSASEEKKMLVRGARWAVASGFGEEGDLDKIEENGVMGGANPEYVSERALSRGKAQLGTLGSGNHFVEVGYVEEIYDSDAARVFHLEKDQVCDDFIRVMLSASQKYGIELPDRQLCCAPIKSPEGRQYLAAMACAVNFAFCNRQIITHWTRQAFEKALSVGPKSIDMQVVYEVAHNIAKIETHMVGGQKREVCVHRKGATRAFGPGSLEVPADYRGIGQPVLIPGDMGRYSFVLLGTDRAMKQTFGSTCHGAGRLLSRKAAVKKARGRQIYKELEAKGVLVRASSYGTMAEEMPEAYKNVEDVVDAVHGAGISKKVAKLRPLGVIKG